MPVMPQNGDVLYNSLILNSEAHALDVFGAYAKSGTAASNFITVNEGAEAKV